MCHAARTLTVRGYEPACQVNRLGQPRRSHAQRGSTPVIKCKSELPSTIPLSPARAFSHNSLRRLVLDSERSWRGGGPPPRGRGQPSLSAGSRPHHGVAQLSR